MRGETHKIRDSQYRIGNTPHKRPSIRFSLFLVSFSVIYLQISLIRQFSGTFYGPLTYFIISLALLGFGASGTFLAFVKKKRKKNHYKTVIIAGLYYLSLILSLYFCSEIRLNLLYLFYELSEFFLLFLFTIMTFLPFFFSGLFIGHTLIGDQKKELLYGINLCGSGMGGLFALIAMFCLPPVRLPVFTLVPAVLALIFVISYRKLKIISAFLLISLTMYLISIFPEQKPDQYKDIYQFLILEEQGDSRLLSESISPYGKTEAWSSPFSHSTLFAGLNNEKKAPTQLSLFLDGSLTSPFFQIDSIEQAEILDETIQSLPYRITDSPRVLIIGDRGLINLWLALRYHPFSVTVVLPDHYAKEFLEENLKEWTNKLFEMGNVEIVAHDYRRFLSKDHGNFDIIHFAEAESLPVWELYSFHEDYTLTVETFSAALSSLSPDGMIALSRGNHFPPRDNLKLFLSLYKCAADSGIETPGKHLSQWSNYLASISILSKNEINRSKSVKMLTEAGALNLEPLYLPGDSFNYESLIDSSLYNLSPPTDNRPYFHSFFQWESLKEFRNLFGQNWFSDIDPAYLILLVTFVFIILISFLLIILPHLFRPEGGKNLFLTYFALIGFAYMFIEMVYIQKMALLLGHVSISVTLVISILLISSGLGSVTVKKINQSLRRKLITASLVIGISTFSLLFFSGKIIEINSILEDVFMGLPWICMLILCFIPGYFMGWYFAPALHHLESINRESLPMAWALNGFASVAASPLAVLLSISYGFILPAGLAVLLYCCASLFFIRKGSI
ncbi:MAG: hypothetical protein JEY91_11795 [Spirochaetaceae bacterium]|nr:hypothetical protein [Spirochaetaceae bacterium]